MIDGDALARFAADMAAAYTRLARGLTTPETEPARFIKGPDVASLLRGHRQRAVFKFLQTVGEEGRTTGEVNDGIGYDFSNTYTTVHRLKDLGIVEMVPGVRPQRWRLLARYRRGNSPE